MKKNPKEGTDVYAAYANPELKGTDTCKTYVSCPCDVETNPCAYCDCAPRSCSCRTEGVAIYSAQEHDPVTLAILRAMEEGKTIDELLERIKKHASLLLGKKGK